MSLEQFHFTVDGVDYSVPKQIPGGALRASRKLDFLDAAFTVFESVADEKTLAAWDTLPSTEGLKIINEWFQGLTVPNSSSSSTSSKSTASPSPETSANASGSPATT